MIAVVGAGADFCLGESAIPKGLLALDFTAAGPGAGRKASFRSENLNLYQGQSARELTRPRTMPRNGPRSTLRSGLGQKEGFFRIADSQRLESAAAGDQVQGRAHFPLDKRPRI